MHGQIQPRKMMLLFALPGTGTQVCLSVWIPPHNTCKHKRQCCSDSDPAMAVPLCSQAPATVLFIDGSASISHSLYVNHCIGQLCTSDPLQCVEGAGEDDGGGGYCPLGYWAFTLAMQSVWEEVT